MRTRPPARPAVATTTPRASARRDGEALEGANSMRYGLDMSVMTADLDRALRFAHGPVEELRAALEAVRASA